MSGSYSRDRVAAPEALVREAARAQRHLRNQYIRRVLRRDRYEVRRARQRLMGSPHSVLTACVEANKALPERERWPLERLIPLARDLSLRGRVREQVLLLPVKKKDGGFRPTLVFGLRFRAMHTLLRWAVEPLVHQYLRRDQLMLRGGVPTATAFVSGLAERREYTHAIQLDIRSFYNSIHVPTVLRKLDFPEGLGDFVLDVGAFSHLIRPVNEIARELVPQCREGLAQGACVSPLLAEFVVASVLGRCPEACFAIYADNILCLDRSAEQVRQVAMALCDVFGRHPFGSFGLTIGETLSLTEGVDFLGHTHQHQGGDWMVRPTDENAEKLIERLNKVLDQGLDGLPTLERWCGGFPAWSGRGDFYRVLRTELGHGCRPSLSQVKTLVRLYQ